MNRPKPALQSCLIRLGRDEFDTYPFVFQNLVLRMLATLQPALLRVEALVARIEPQSNGPR